MRAQFLRHSAVMANKDVYKNSDVFFCGVHKAMTLRALDYKCARTSSPSCSQCVVLSSTQSKISGVHAEQAMPMPIRKCPGSKNAGPAIVKRTL